MTVITPQRSLMGISSADMRQETDRMLTRLAQVTSQQGQNAGIPQDAPTPPLSLRLYAGGLLQTQGQTADYTLLGAVITFGAAPAIGIKLISWYRTQ